MTVYARSDVAAVSISVDHGGCGEVHSRPVIDGAPVKLWSLTCHAGCEDVLRGDAHWAGTPHTIPETPDETAIRMDVEKRGQIEQQTSMASALNDLAKLGALPGVLSQLMSHLGPVAVDAEQLNKVCRNGHVSGPTVKFCGECGSNLEDAVNKKPVAALSVSEKPVPTETGDSNPEKVERSEKTTRTSEKDLQGKSLNELRVIARGLGADNANSKKDLIANILRVSVSS